MSETGREPAFAFTWHGENGPCAEPGLSKREFAAMMLKVPTSGTDWLDEMIRQSLRADIKTVCIPVEETDEK